MKPVASDLAISQRLISHQTTDQSSNIQSIIVRGKQDFLVEINLIDNSYIARLVSWRAGSLRATSL